MAERTVPELILDAARELEASPGGAPYTVERLAVFAWQKWPQRFGLAGYKELHPDPNLVRCVMMGARGMVAAGKFTKNGRLYRLTLAGSGKRPDPVYAAPPEARPAQTAPVVIRHKTTPAADAELSRLLGTDAWAAFRRKSGDPLTFADACFWWDISAEMASDEVAARLAAVKAAIGAQPPNGCLLSSGRVVHSEELFKLAALNARLEERFGRHLTLLQNRKKPQPA
jgi:hypothetical protein